VAATYPPRGAFKHVVDRYVSAAASPISSGALRASRYDSLADRVAKGPIPIDETPRSDRATAVRRAGPRDPSRSPNSNRKTLKHSQRFYALQSGAEIWTRMPSGSLTEKLSLALPWTAPMPAALIAVRIRSASNSSTPTQK